MRIIQGIAVAFIVVGKRAHFVDRFKGEKLKNYISLFSIVWATAPITAPFVGGYLQAAFGWQANFYFLAVLTLLMAALEFTYGGETLKNFQPFNIKPIADAYLSMIKTADYSVGLIIIALCYSSLVVFGMTSPFIIEHVLNYSPVITGYCSLLSGVALMCGGIISKTLIKKPFFKKISIAISVQVIFAASMIFTSGYTSNIYTLMSFVLVIHFLSGFLFNNFYSYCLGRFSTHAGMASGITGGGVFIATSFFSYNIVQILDIRSQTVLGTAYLIIVLMLGLFYILFNKSLHAYRNNQLIKLAPRTIS
jgi:MFS family permease